MATPNISVSVIGDVKDIRNSLKSVEGQLGNFGKSVGKVGGLLKGAFAFAAGGAIVGQFNQLVNAGSDLQETMSKSQTVFGSAAKDIEAFADRSAKALGMSKQEALAGMAQFGNLFDQLKIGKPAAANMAKGFAQMSADLASFNNLEPAAVMEAFTSATRGEFDALQAVIPTINAAALETEALRQTHKKSAKDLTEADKVNALYALSLKGMGKAQGDFKKTSGGVANQQRIANAEFKNAQAAIGTFLLPVMTKLLTFVNKTGIPAMKEFGGYFKKELLPAIKDVGTTMKAIVVPAFETLQKVFASHGPAVVVLVASLVGLVAVYKTYQVVLAAVTAAQAAYAGVMAGVAAVQKVMAAQLVTTRIGLAALAVQQVVVSAATKIWAAVQWVMNAAMYGFPLVWIIAAIVAVIAIIVLAIKYHKEIAKAIGVAWEAVKTATVTAWNAVKSAISTAINAVKSAVSTGLGAIKTAVSTAFGAVLGAVRTAWTSITTAVSTAIGAVVRLHQGIKAKVLGAISGAASWLYNIGRDIVQGLINGIGARAGALIDKARGLANSVKDTIAGALKIGSPSMVMRDIGRWTGEGMALGLNDSITRVRKVSSLLAKASLNGFVNRTWAATAAAKTAAVQNRTPTRYYNLQVNAPVGSNPAGIGKEIIKYIKAHEEVQGPRWRN